MMADLDSGAVDVHAHCVPRSVLDHVERHGERFGITTSTGSDGPRWRFGLGHQSAPIEPLLLDTDARIDRMNARGVAVQLLSSFIDVGAHRVPGRAAAAYARMFNEGLAELVSAHPNRLRGLATLPVQNPEVAAAELEYAVTRLGFVGAEVTASGVGDPEWEPLWAAAAALGAVILVHPEASTTSMLPYFLGNFVGNPAETTIAAASLIMSGTLERHPDLVVVLVHGGGFLPYQGGRLRKGFAMYDDRFGAHLTVDPMSQLRWLYYDTILHDRVALESLVRLVGAEHVLTGTDDPFLMGDPDPRTTVLAVPSLSEHEQQLILAGNARRLLRVVDKITGR